MCLSRFHAKYFAYDLTRRCASDSVEKLAPVLADAQVDLNPHQVEAALFAFRNPFSRGAILADEVGLGKTIEAGLLLSQKWAERKRRLMVIVPASLRKQWSQELADEWDGDEDGTGPSERARLTPEQVVELRREMTQLREFHSLAESIIQNSKGEVLLAALRRGFAAAAGAQTSQGAATLQQKAVIFTESRRT